MFKKLSKIKNQLLTIGLAISIILVTFVLMACIPDSVEQIGVLKISVYLFSVLGILTLVYFLFRTFNHVLSSMSRWTLILLLCLFYIILFAFSCLVRNEPTTDYEMVFNSAIALSNNESVPWQYFSKCYNNSPLLYCLTLCAKISQLIGLSDPFYVMLAFNTLLVTFTALSLYYIVGYYYKSKRYLQFFSIFTFLLFVPLWGGTQYFYTENVTLLYGLGTIACYLHGKKHGNKLFAVLAGSSLALGLLLKVTIIFFVLAFIIVELLTLNKCPKIKSYVFYLATIIGTFTILMFTYKILDSNAPYHEFDATEKVPLQTWFAIGLIGDGRWGQDQEFINNYMYGSMPIEQRTTEINEYIAQNIHNLWNLDHNISKARINFANGQFGLYFYQYYGGMGYVLFRPFSTIGYHTTIFNLIYFYVILTILIISSILQLFTKKKNIPLLTGTFSIAGFILFMMLWEAYDRQLYNQMPVLALLAAIGIDYIFVSLMQLRKETNYENR